MIGPTLAGCRSKQGESLNEQVRFHRNCPPDGSRPNLFIKDDAYIIVDQDPIYVAADPASITWALADNSSYYFANNNAVSIPNPPRPNRFQCQTIGTPAKLITCTYDKEHKKKYIY